MLEILGILIRGGLLLGAFRILNEWLQFLAGKSRPFDPPSPKPETQTAKVRTPAPQPEKKCLPHDPIPEKESEGTCNGFWYKAHREGAHLLVYEGVWDADDIEIPNYIDSQTPVTYLEDRLCAGLTFRKPIYLPDHLDYMGSEVFDDTEGVYFVIANSCFHMEKESFTWCDLQTVVLTKEALNIQWTAYGAYRFVRYGDETPFGTLQSFQVDGNRALYGCTDRGETVLLDLADDGMDYTVPAVFEGFPGCPVRGIDRHALDYIEHEITIHVPERCAFDASLLKISHFDIIAERAEP